MMACADARRSVSKKCWLRFLFNSLARMSTSGCRANTSASSLICIRRCKGTKKNAQLQDAGRIKQKFWEKLRTKMKNNRESGVQRVSGRFFCNYLLE